MSSLRPSIRIVPAVLTSLAVVGCSGGGAATAPTPVAMEASEEEWEALATPRPEPLEGAPRISVGAFEILGTAPWSLDADVDLSVGLSELVAAGLLRRRGVNFVERRRFAAAAERERRGLPRSEGAPAAGVSVGAEMILTAAWATLGLDSAYLDLRLADAESGDMVTTWRAATANDAGPTALARTAVGSLLEALDELGRRPAWTDPEPAAAFSTYRASPVPLPAVEAFFRGLAAEEGWEWEAARRGYQRALRAADGDFLEAEAALARAARLRQGGTLGR